MIDIKTPKEMSYHRKLDHKLHDVFIVAHTAKELEEALK
jgi:hypothetical protein